MAQYKLLVTAKDGMLTQGLLRNGQPIPGSEKNITFIVESSYPDRVWFDDLMKQNGCTPRPGIGRPSGWLTSANGWTIKPL